uniref:uncharacterized protein LOC120333411 n=1 Tax=Styela clava TaxID=7725 RepID=UPI001939A68F|nr:uncharacterized protein LOC120333411 [Styela clava]
MANVSEVNEFLSDIFKENQDLKGTATNETTFISENDVVSLFADGPQDYEQSSDGYFAFSRHVPELPNTISGKIITGFTIYDAVFVFVILLFVAKLEDAKILAEKQPIFIPSRPVKGFRKYAVLLETGQSPAGGTTSGVFIRLCGKLTKSPAFSLSWRNNATRQLFWSRNKDVFILSVPHYLGYIEAIEIMTDAAGQSPPWFLKKIRVMCLDNRKCWKSKVHAWLRGDRKPFSFKTYLIGALSTKEYMEKVFLQNHAWTTMWHRALGSSFTCAQRCAIQWSSVSIAMFASHFLMYKWPYERAAQFDEATGLRIPMEYIIRGDDAVSAGVLGALAGTAVGMLIRGIARQSTSANKWARVDDKDDFAHIMGPEDLTFIDGAVVIANRPDYSGPKFPPYPPCVDDTVLKILDTLTPGQISTMKRLVECGDGSCEMKEMLENQTCCQAKEKTEEADPTQPAPSAEKIPTEEKVVEKTVTIEEDAPPMNAEKRGYRKSIAQAMYSMWDTTLTGLGVSSGKDDTSDGETTVPKPSAGTNLETKNEKQYRSPRRLFRDEKRKRRVGFQGRSAPSISARISDGSNDSMKNSSVMGGSLKEDLVVPLPEDYDSLSDPESDEEIVTKAIKGSHGINLRRRSQKVYDMAPWWDDRHRVYVSAPDAGNEHHQAVNERYERTATPETACCKVRAEAVVGEEPISKYLDEEIELPPGSVGESGSGGASMVCGFALLAGVVLSPYVLYERLPLPNAHALYYLYAVMLCFVFHSLVFCTADAMACAIMATWTRRRRIAQTRSGGTEECDATATDEHG